MAYENGRRILGYFKKCQHKSYLERSFMRGEHLKWRGHYNPTHYCDGDVRNDKRWSVLENIKQYDNRCWYCHDGYRQKCTYRRNDCVYRYWLKPQRYSNWCPPKLRQKITNKRIRHQTRHIGCTKPSDYKKVGNNRYRIPADYLLGDRVRLEVN